MAKKAIKIILIILMIIGVSFSIINFMSFNLNAGELGIWDHEIDECEGYPIACKKWGRG